MAKTAFPVIAETIVVEGRDDTNSIKRAVAAETIETHGFGIRRETSEQVAARWWAETRPRLTAEAPRPFRGKGNHHE